MDCDKHTPGPWQVSGDSKLNVYSAKTGDLLARAITGGPPAVANARLIGAAPELLEALEILMEAQRRSDPFNDQGNQAEGDVLMGIALAKAGAAIAKATASESGAA